MKFIELDWDDWNVDHIARHGITVDEVEETCLNNPWIVKGRQKRYYVSGQTNSGLYLFIVIDPPRWGSKARVATARPMDNSERQRYLRR